MPFVNSFINCFHGHYHDPRIMMGTAEVSKVEAGKEIFSNGKDAKKAAGITGGRDVPLTAISGGVFEHV